MESNQMPIEQVKLLSHIDGIGKKCYATAKVTHEKGDFPNKKYYTTNKLKYVGLYIRDENLNGSFRKYFHHPTTQKEIFFENINPLLSTISSPSQKDGFVEVMCQGNKIRSLQDLSRGSFKKYAQQQSEKVKNDIADLLNNQYIVEIVYPVKPSNGGKKRRRTTRKRSNRKSRKNRRKSIRR